MTVVAITLSSGSVARKQFVQQDIDDAGIQGDIDRTVWHADDGVPVSWRRVTLSDFPSDSTFRGAWTDTGTKIEVDMPRAREIHRARLRVLRAPILAELDVAYQRADERGDKADKARIGAQKQALRDVTDDPAISKATTPEALKMVVPDILQPAAPRNINTL